MLLYKIVSETSLETLWDLILESFWEPKVSTILFFGGFLAGRCLGHFWKGARGAQTGTEVRFRGPRGWGYGEGRTPLGEKEGSETAMARGAAGYPAAHRAMAVSDPSSSPKGVLPSPYPSPRTLKSAPRVVLTIPALLEMCKKIPQTISKK